MARGSNRTSGKSDEKGKVEETTAPETTETTEGTTETTEGTEPEAPTTPEDEAKAREAEQAEIEAKAKAADEALEAFKSTTEAAVAGSDEVPGADSTTGEMPAVALQGINKAYADLPDAKTKSAARAWLAQRMEDLMAEGAAEGDMSKVVQASAFVKVGKQLTVAKATKVSEPVDPTQAYVEKLAALTLAYQMTYSDTPEGVKSGWEELVEKAVEGATDSVQKYRDWVDAKLPEGEQPQAEPEVPAFVKSAFRIVAGKSTRGKGKAQSTTTTPRASGGPKRNIGLHISEYFLDKSEGHFATIGEITKFESNEYKGTVPSQGAISQRAFPGNGRAVNLPEGLEPAEQGGRKGIRKAA